MATNDNENSVALISPTVRSHAMALYALNACSGSKTTVETFAVISTIDDVHSTAKNYAMPNRVCLKGAWNILGG